jgi:hypothetical protein
VFGRSLRSSPAKHLSGNRERETRVERCARCSRCASETPPYSDSYSIADTHLDSNPKTIANANSNPHANGDSNVYSDAHGDIHSDSHRDCHSYSYPYSHGGCACLAWCD